MEEILDNSIGQGQLKKIDPLKGRWTFLCIAVLVSLIPIMIEMWLIITMIGVFNEILGGNQMAAWRLMGMEETEKTVLILYYVFFAVSVVAVCMWVFTANRNLGMAGLRYIDYSPALAVGSFFIPFANWVMPFIAMREIDRGSQSLSKPEERESWKRNKFNALLLVWFLTYAISAILFSYLYFKTKSVQTNTPGMETFHTVHFMLYLYVGAYVLRIISGIGLVLYTRRITEFHNAHVELTRQ